MESNKMRRLRNELSLEHSKSKISHLLELGENKLLGSCQVMSITQLPK